MIRTLLIFVFMFFFVRTPIVITTLLVVLFMSGALGPTLDALMESLR